jgi:hypothetical protein
VPASAIDDYRAANVWREFGHILPSEEITGIAETRHATSLQVYPNPTTGVVTIANADGAEVKVYNLSGELLHRSRESCVDLSGYPSGVYLLRIGDEALKVVKK